MRQISCCFLLLALTSPAVTAQVTSAPTAAGGVEAIGPKQDDPRTAGIIVQGGLAAPGCGDGATGPKRGSLAIGPKQDDPLKRGIAARPGDDNDPKASPGAGTSAREAGSSLATGRRALAIGPKQDDPSRPGLQSRPGDDNDPKARCMPAGR